MTKWFFNGGKSYSRHAVGHKDYLSSNSKAILNWKYSIARPQIILQLSSIRKFKINMQKDPFSNLIMVKILPLRTSFITGNWIITSLVFKKKASYK